MLRRSLIAGFLFALTVTILASAAQISPGFSLAENSILITDMPSSRLIRVTDLSSTGWQEGPTASGTSLNWPWHFSLDSSGRVYIADRDNGRIVRVDDVAGAGWTTFEGIGSNLLVPLPRLTGLTGGSGAHFISSTFVDPAGRIYATMDGRLVRLDSMDGAGWTTFTTNVSGLKSVVLDQQGRIYLSDNSHHWIARMNDMQGTGWVTYGSHGNGVGQFNEPEGLTIDSQGRIYLADETNHQIVRINDMTGAGWTAFGSFGSGVGQFSLPHDVQVDSLGRIYIADTGNWRIVRINSMKGDGWVSFGANGCHDCNPPMLGPFLMEAPKGIRVLGTGPSLTYRAVFPQVAVGGSYRTSIVGINTGASSVDGEISFTTAGAPCQDGFPFACGTSFPVTVGSVAASTFNRTIAPMGTVRLEATSAGSLASGYARLRSAEELVGIALFQAMSGDTIMSEAGVGLSSPSEHFTIYIDNLNNAQTGYAIANPLPEGMPTSVAKGQGRAYFTMTLRNKAGAALETISTNIGPGGHFAEFASQRFPAKATAGFEGSIEFSSSAHDKLQAVALRYDNSTQEVFTTVPVVQNVDDPNKIPYIYSNGVHTTIPRVGTRTLYYPQVADGSTYRTNFILVNATDTATTATLEFFSSSGAPLSLPIEGVQQTSQTVQLGAYGVARVVTDGTSSAIKTGWARVTSAADIGGSAIFQTVVGGRITSEAGVQSSPLAARFATYVSTLGFTDSGVAVANPNSSTLNVTFNLRSSSGQIVASTVKTLPAAGHMAQMLSQLFPAFDEFEGMLEMTTSGSAISGVALRYDNPGGTVFATTPVIVIP